MSNVALLRAPASSNTPVTTSGLSQGSAAISTATAWASPTAWTELIASLPFDIRGFYLTAGVGGSNQYYADIAVGASGSEQRIGVPYPVQTNFLQRWWYPVALKAGSRLSVRSASATSSTMSVQVSLAPATPLTPVGYAQWTTFGHDDWAGGAGFPSLVSDSGATANVKGAWVEITPSLPFSARWLQLLGVNSVTTSNNAASFLIDIGVGAAGSELVALANLYGRHNGNIRERACFLSDAVEIPAGSRVAFRHQSSNSNSTMRLLAAWFAFGG